MNREEIKKLLPHPEPMLLVDEAEAVDEKTARGSYTIKGDEFFLQGHFPGQPVTPGVMLCEMMAQTCCVLLSGQSGGKTPYFTSLDKVKFKKTVLPGDKLEIECVITNQKGPFYFAQGKGRVGGKLAVSADFSFALIDNSERK